ncbi:MAG TPA: hypothetical protein VKR06_09150 [Ktedonosporobacter sp.]|nr:hypothetical protein [Ktedonosporobacter sp.]
MIKLRDCGSIILANYKHLSDRRLGGAQRANCPAEPFHRRQSPPPYPDYRDSGRGCRAYQDFERPQLYGATDDLTPVILRFVDLNGDHRPDMLVSFASSRLVFINDGISFRPLLPAERASVEHALQGLQP